MNNREENTGFVVVICLVAAIGGFLFGFDSGVINGTIDGLQSTFQSTSAGTGLNVASMLIGCAVGAFIAGGLADKIGRKKLLILTALFFLISAVGSGLANSSLSFVVFRLLGGLAVGAASIITPAYIAEIAPARYRGALATIQQIAIILGLFSAFLSNYFLAELAGGSTALLWGNFATWRWMFWVESVPAIIFLVALLFIPESPRFLVLNSKVTQAHEVLSNLYGNSVANKTLADIQTSLSESSENQSTFANLKNNRTGKVKTLVWVGIGLATFQQLVGINVVFYYGAVLWQAVGFSESDALIINIISGGVSIVACVITLLFIDKLGRKPFLLCGSIGMTITLGILVFAFINATINADGQVSLGQCGTLALIAANAYVFFFNMSWGPVMWVMLGEMFPNAIRGSGLAISGFAQWSSNFIITLTFPILLTSIGLAGAYGLYFTGAAISIVFVYTMVSETKGKTLEEMQG